MSEKIKQVFNVESMKCGGCVSTVKAVLQELDNTDVNEVSLEDKLVVVESSKLAQEIADAITAAGFPAELK